MGTTDISLERIFRQIIAGNVGQAIDETETYLTAWPSPQTSEKLRSLKEDYLLMIDYWLQGVSDPSREEQYQQLLQRLYVLCGNISIHRHISGSAFLTQLSNAPRKDRHWSLTSIRKEMEDFVANVAMLELEGEHTRKEKSQEIYKEHYQQMNHLFNYLVTSRIWNDGIGKSMEEILLSPTIDSNDQQLLLSAIMLSLMNRFDIVKFRMMVNIYRLAQDEAVRQRALTGWALCIDDDYLAVYPEMRQLIESLLQSKRACRELTELQMQLVYTMNSENDSSKIHNEILPDIIKNNDTFRITHNGIEEVEEDPMEDILHPNAAEERMEKLEASIHKMTEMQRQGVDIFFGGFSQMKRYPFFYDISNWFVPFFLQHPDIRQFLENEHNNKFIRNITRHGPFCNSDKYSFVIAFRQVAEHMPKSMHDLLEKQELSLVGTEEIPIEEQLSGPYIRRIYLMDLYRFFRLFPNRAAFCDPFDKQAGPLGMCLFFTSALFKDTPLDQHKRDIVIMLRKRGLTGEAEALLDTFPEEMRDQQYYLWKADYNKVLDMEPDNERALAGRARAYFGQGNYEEASDDYERLLQLYPDKMGYMLNKAVCLVNMEEYEDALHLLYRLNYEHEEDVKVQRVLAWTLTCCGKLEQAEGIFHTLTTSEHTTVEDHTNYAYCLWVKGDLRQAAESFHKVVEGANDPYEKLNGLFHHEWLKARGISDIDIKLMQSLVLAQQ